MLAPMRTFPLPGLAPAASVVLGSATIGSAIPRDESFRLLDRYVALGGTTIDTANCYAEWLPGGAGRSETTIGEWLRDRGLAGTVQVWTKGGHPPFDRPLGARLKPADIAHDLDQSLARLKLDRVALYWLHRDDPAIPVGEVLDALAPHLASGRIGAIGASNWMPARLDAAAHWARANQRTGFVASQCAFSLAIRSPQSPPFAGCLDVDEAFLEWHRRGGFPLAAYTPQANGFFAKNADADPAPVAGDPWRWSANLPRLRRARELAERYDVPINRIALAYVLDQTFPTAAIVGARTVAQLEDSWAALELRLEAQDVAYLEGEEI